VRSRPARRINSSHVILAQEWMNAIAAHAGVVGYAANNVLADPSKKMLRHGCVLNELFAVFDC
jgi:hypothetical protein